MHIRFGCHLSPFNLEERKQYKQIVAKLERCLRIATTMVPSFFPESLETQQWGFNQKQPQNVTPPQTMQRHQYEHCQFH